MTTRGVGYCLFFPNFSINVHQGTKVGVFQFSRQKSLQKCDFVTNIRYVHLPTNIYRYWTAILDGNIERLLNEFKLHSPGGDIKQI